MVEVNTWIFAGSDISSDREHTAPEAATILLIQRTWNRKSQTKPVVQTISHGAVVSLQAQHAQDLWIAVKSSNKSQKGSICLLYFISGSKIPSAKPRQSLFLWYMVWQHQPHAKYFQLMPGQHFKISWASTHKEMELRNKRLWARVKVNDGITPGTLQWLQILSQNR